MERHELIKLGVGELGEQARAMGLDWHHLPLRDVSVPTADFEVQWRTSGSELRAYLLGGEGVVVHCRGGLGRTGLVAARLLIELGEHPPAALRRVRAARPGAVETHEQERYVLQCVPPSVS